MSAFRRFALCASALVLGISGAAATEHRAYFSHNKDPRLPECTENSVQSAVAGTVARAHHDYYGGRTITGIDQIAEVAYRENGVSVLARRYCEGVATLTDGSSHVIYYKLVEHAGFVGVRWNVEACMARLDKYRVYDGRCRTTRP